MQSVARSNRQKRKAEKEQRKHELKVLKQEEKTARQQARADIKVAKAEQKTARKVDKEAAKQEGKVRRTEVRQSTVTEDVRLGRQQTLATTLGALGELGQAVISPSTETPEAPPQDPAPEADSPAAPLKQPTLGRKSASPPLAVPPNWMWVGGAAVILTGSLALGAAGAMWWSRSQQEATR